jgi:NhaA family Na+:H+ antiporter
MAHPSPESAPVTSRLPVAPVERLLYPVKRFLHIEATSGILLMACTLLALVVANSPWAEAFAHFWETPLSFHWGKFHLDGTLGELLINDALMTIFFFVVGLEVKREVVCGELREFRKALLPIVGALGGAVTPALIYLALQQGQPGESGWAIPMATDIAFVIGFLTLFGRRVPFGLKVFLLTLAIVDDLIAVVIIATFFSDSLNWIYLGWSVVGFALVYLMNRIGVRALFPYFAVGIAIWLAFHHAGLHPTLAGVVLGLLTPTQPWIGQRTLLEVFHDFWDQLQAVDGEADKLPVNVEQLQFAARESLSPLHRLELSLHPWVAFVIMPVFALSNAGVPLEAGAITNPVALAVAAGLVLGKPLGILLFCGVAVLLRISRLPDGVSWSLFAGGACFAGIGFTMALFLTNLAFNDELESLQPAGKIGTLIGSALSAIAGSILLLRALSRNSPIGFQTGTSNQH